MRYSYGRTYYYRSRYHTGWRPRSTRRRDTRLQLGKILLTLLFLGMLGWGIWNVFGFFSGFLYEEPATATVEIYKGTAQFRIAEANSPWTSAFSDQVLVEGDTLQVGPTGFAALSIPQIGKIYLDNATRLKILTLADKEQTSFTGLWELQKGQIFVDLHPSTSYKEVSFIVKVPQGRIRLFPGKANIAFTEDGVLLQVLEGSAQVELLNHVGEVAKTFQVEMGQEMEISDKSFSASSQMLRVLNPKFLESDWYLKILSIANPEALANLKKTTTEEAKATEAAPEQNPNAASSAIEPPSILQPANNSHIPASQDLVKIEGLAPLKAFQIQVNGYTLSKFQPGDRKWTYFAARKFNTLKPGKNVYQVIAVDREGNMSPPATLTLYYDAPILPEKPTEQPSSQAAPQDTTPSPSSVEPQTSSSPLAFPKPVVTMPAIFKQDPQAIYQTSSPVITIKGEVDPQTQAVEVNHFRLRKFKPGDTTFTYITNAHYGNLREGENTFTIVAIGPNGKRSQRQIKIIYQPLDIDPAQ